MTSPDSPLPLSITAPFGEPAPDDDRVVAALEEYVKLQEADERVDRAAFVARFPDIAEVLAACLDGLDFVRGAGRQLGSSAGNGPAFAAGPAAALPLGDFRLVRELGRGGMGVVYEAEQLSLGRRVALKVLPLAATLDPRRLQRFKNEVQAAAALHHTNIVPVYFVGCDRGVHYYAMQLIQGQTLGEVIQDLRRQRDGVVSSSAADTPVRAALTTERSDSLAFCRAIARLGVQAAAALEHAHQVGVVHRDIKPSNLMLDARGDLWVADFGLARLPGDPGLTLSGDLVGTLRYMSPEQALGKRPLIDHRTDIYSLGATLYELLTLEPVFAGKDREELLRQFTFEDPVPPRRLNKAIPADLEAIVLKALEKSPSDRYASAQELADDLEHHLRDEPIRARRPGVRVRLTKWARRHRPLVAGLASAAAILVLALVAGAFWYAADASERAAQRVHLNNQISDALAEASTWMGEAQRGGGEHAVAWARAREAAGRARTLADSRLADPGLVQRVRELLARLDEQEQDRNMVAWLDAARLPPLSARGHDYDFQWSSGQYAEAFRKYGVDLNQMPAVEASARIARRAIKLNLVAALDDWAAQTHEQPQRERLLQIARMADDDAWRNQVRAAFLANDLPALKALSASADVATLPPPTLLLLAEALDALGETGAAANLLQRAQPAHAGDFWINLRLGMFLVRQPRRSPPQAIPFFTAAVALRPDSPIPHNNLGNVLAEVGQWDAAIGQYREAIRLKNDYATAHGNLGNAFKAQGKLADAVRAYRESLRLDDKQPQPHANLSDVLRTQGEVDDAIAAAREALKLLDFPEAHHDLGMALLDKAGREEAAGQQEAARDHQGEGHFHLGLASKGKNDLKSALAEYREAIRLQPNMPEYHNALGVALHLQGDYEGAIVALRRSLELNKDSATAHNNLGFALSGAERWDEAIADYRRALQLEANSPLTYFRLATAYRAKGDFRSALDAVRRGHELGLKDPFWRVRSGKWVLDHERFTELDDKLPALLAHQIEPATPAERIELAELCTMKHLPAAAARFYKDAFAADPGLVNGHRYKAACAAALAGCGKGKDAAQIDDGRREALRGESLHWLRDELASLSKQERPPPARLEQHLRRWQRDPALAGVREPAEVAKLPDSEQARWGDLWAEVANVLERTQRP
jgi:serine/threonine protein kinase/Flp pilus assembly protein TadD